MDMFKKKTNKQKNKVLVMTSQLSSHSFLISKNYRFIGGQKNAVCF